MFKYPFLKPKPPALSRFVEDLELIERSRQFSNYGPVNQRFEDQIIKDLFLGEGFCITMNNATSGLILAIRQVTQAAETSKKKYALMPSFTFAATAQAALWNGCDPLFCDINPDTWLPDKNSEISLIEQYQNEIAVIVPYATFGNNLDLDHYCSLNTKFKIPVVIDAAASLGSFSEGAKHFGRGSPLPIVFSMHATKTFSTSEAGMVYCSDSALIEELRRMGNFGFSDQRIVLAQGLNSKLSEIAAFLCVKKLENFNEIVDHRMDLAEGYRQELEGFRSQKLLGKRHSMQFFPVVLPENFIQRSTRSLLLDKLKEGGILDVRQYFSPHLAEQPFFKERVPKSDHGNTDSLSARILSLPIYDDLSKSDIREISDTLKATIQSILN